MQAEAGKQFQITCSTSIARPIVWLQTVNETGVFNLPNSTRVIVSPNGLVLNFTVVNLVDQEYYACAYYDASNVLRVIQAYYLFVKVYPFLSMVVGTSIINQTDTITFNAPGNYQLACLAVDAKPDVDLDLYDSFSFESLNNGSNTQTTHSCNANNLCNVIFRVDLSFTPASRFLYMTSLSCSSRSRLPQIELDRTITRKVRVLYNDQPIVPNPFQNATSLIATALRPYTIFCNATGVDVTGSITWIRTANKTGQYFVPYDNRVSLSNNGLNLNIATVELVDEEYYACAFQLTSSTYRLLGAFYLYVRG